MQAVLQTPSCSIKPPRQARSDRIKELRNYKNHDTVKQTHRFTKDEYLTEKLDDQGEQHEGNWLSPGPKLVRFSMTTEEGRKLEGLPRSMLAQGKMFVGGLIAKQEQQRPRCLSIESPDAIFAMYSYLEYYKK